VSLEFGAGNGVFRSGPTFAAGTSPLQVAAADLNGDHQLDVVVANGLAGKGATVLLGNGHGTFQTARHFDTDGPSPALAVGDLNGDRSPDYRRTRRERGRRLLTASAADELQSPLPNDPAREMRRQLTASALLQAPPRAPRLSAPHRP